MKNTMMIDAVVAAYAAPASAHVAIADLQVYARAVTSSSAWGEVCPTADPTGIQASRTSLRLSSQRSETGAVFVGTGMGLGATRNLKSRNGSYAISGTG